MTAETAAAMVAVVVPLGDGAVALTPGRRSVASRSASDSQRFDALIERKGIHTCRALLLTK